MKKLFLTSSVGTVASDIAKKIGKRGLRLLCVITASEIKEGNLKWLERDKKALKKGGFKVEEYTFTGKTREEIREKLTDVDVLYMSGGNVFYLLQQIQQTKCADLICDFVERGKIYIGTSAGSIVAGPDTYPVYRLDNAKQAPKLKGYKGLGLIDVVIFPHWGSAHFKARYLHQRLEHAFNLKNKIILLTDKQYLMVVGDTYKIFEV